MPSTNLLRTFTSIGSHHWSKMLNNANSVLEHRIQNALLILLGLLFLPLDITLLILSYLRRSLLQQRPSHGRNEAPKRILVTGVGMTKGLSLARLFHRSGEVVIGADFSSVACGRVSNCISRYYVLQKPSPSPQGSSTYVESLLSIIIREKIDLWVSCSGVASAVEDGEAKEAIESRTKCKAIQFDIPTTKVLHEKDSFISHTESLGLPVPATHAITSLAAVETVLRSSPAEREYIMKTVGVSDANRADMTLLSARNIETSLKHLRNLPISEKDSWIIQQYIRGPEYCTHALIINREVRAFVACPSAELLMHYVALPLSSPLSQAMLKFTQTFTRKQTPNFTGHLSFDFMVPNPDATNADDIELYPIECNPRAHTAVALFQNTPDMVADYLSLLDPIPPPASPSSILQPNGHAPPSTIMNGPTTHSFSSKQPTTPINPPKIYWQSHELVTNLIIPTIELLQNILPFQSPNDTTPTTITSSSPTSKHSSLESLTSSLITLALHLTTWHDGTYDSFDPLPWWWLTHIYWPTQFLWCFWNGRKWSRCNVSTCKMFEC